MNYLLLMSANIENIYQMKALLKMNFQTSIENRRIITVSVFCHSPNDKI